MVVLETLDIQRFRKVEPGTKLRFQGGRNVLLGKNATGKTTLLDLIASAVSLDFSLYAMEPFDIAFQLSDAERTMRVGVSNRLRNVGASQPYEASLREAMMAPELDMRAEIEIREAGKAVMTCVIDGASLSIQLKGGRSTTNPVRVPVMGGNLLLALMFADVKEVFPHVHTFFRSSRLVRFDESLDYFQTIISHSKVRTFSIEGTLHSGSRGLPGEVEDAVQTAVEADSDVSTVQMRDLKVLRRLNPLLGFKSSALYVDRLEKTPAREGIPEQIEFGNLRAQFTRHDGGIIDHSRLSYGQKRLFAFHFWLAAFDQFVVADELANGLHHSWIESCVEALKGRQAFLTTQHPLLLDYLDFGSEESVAASFITCKCASPSLTDEWMRWTNISERDAHSFYRAHKSGIESVSEILVSRGLW